MAVCRDVICAQPSSVYNVRHPESRINELFRHQQRGIEYSDEADSQQAAALSDRFFVPSAEQVDTRGRYRRQREYPQPPPPNKSTSKITINRVSIVSPLFGLSILWRSRLCARTCCSKKAVISDCFCRVLGGTKHERTVAAVESLDQKVEFDFDSRTTVNESV